MTDTREASIDWVARALAEELRDPEAAARNRAENLVAIAEQYRLPIEHVVAWVHMRSPQKQWTAAEFRRFASLYDETRRQTLQIREGDAWRKLCPQCWSEVAHAVNGAWRCAKCGTFEAAAEGEQA